MPRGRFLSREELEKLRTSSQERTDKFEAKASPNNLNEVRAAIAKSTTISKDITMSFYNEEELADLHKRFSTRRP